MRIALALAPMLVTGCFDGPDHEEVPGVGGVSVTVTDSFSGTVEARACLGAKFLVCEGETTVVELRHDGVVTPMTFSGFFPAHQATAPMGDPTKPFVITDGVAPAEMFLPPAFDLAGDFAAERRLGDVIEMNWTPGDSPMRWDVNFTCGNGGGGVLGGALDDADGSLRVEVSEIAAEIQKVGNFTPTDCDVEIKVLRILEGTLHEHFRAGLATGVQERKFGFAIVN
jgi:hypothetical protein